MLHEHDANAKLFSACSTISTILRSRSRCSTAPKSCYADLIARRQMENVLVSRGVKPGDRVAAQTENRAGLVLYLATVRVARCICRSTRLYAERTRIFHTDATVAVVCDPSKRRHRCDRAKVKARSRNARADGKGSLTDPPARRTPRFTPSPAPTTTSPRSLHLRHTPVQGRDADS